MKNSCLFLSAVLLLASCSQAADSPLPAVETVSVAFTRAGDGGGVSAYAYRCGGLLEAAASGTAGTASMSVTSGVPLDYLVACGLPAGMADPAMTLDGILTRTLGLSSQLEAQTALAVRRELSLSADTVLACSPVRVVSRVSLDTVVCTRPGGLELVRVYLSNVCGVSALSGETSDDGVWHCRMGDPDDCPGDVRPALVSDLSRPLDEGVPFAAGLSFLLFRNPSSSDASMPEDSVWCPRPSRLVLECRDGGRTVWYPITLPALEPNTDLRVRHLTLYGDGTDHPDIPVNREALAFDVTVLPWEYVTLTVNN